ncbi:alanine racemase [Labrys monachus]|uniref:D-serine deaminase-like pyridoxal phosphate-dependent protein n=1 Tax=Labrys monachus TaxID=217067 RepID=A0ABU0FJN8_9HYPH|nr:alanine racemase [Labrys monachus]MDQ0394820.1 D-serine deaminase-like pyridoxal phosphate-dependent protein [Labrys monachus]
MHDEAPLRWSGSDRILTEIETPAVIVDAALLRRNIAAAAARARSAGVALRPHVKTHKSVALARMQIEAGAAGLTVAKGSEALVFLEAGFRDITVGQPLVDRRKIARLLAAARDGGARLTLIADSDAGIAAVAAEAAAQGVRADVQVKIDVGLHRCGVSPAGGEAVRLARLIADDAALRFAGILSHAGHAYSAPTPEAVTVIARQEHQAMLGVADALVRAGIGVPCISVGSTPTVWLGDRFDGISEIRPGNYVFMDLTQVSLGVATRDDLALSVLATVISCNDTYAIVDAGSKVMSSDRGPHGSTRLAGYGVARRLGDADGADMPVASLSEEHGFVAHGGRRPAIGERLRLLPNHACTVVNLARNLVVAGQGGIEGGIETWPVDARACVS